MPVVQRLMRRLCAFLLLTAWHAAAQNGTTADDYEFSSVLARPVPYDGRILSYARSIEPGARITALASDGLFLFFAASGFPFCTIGRVPLLLPISDGDLTECFPGQERPTSIAVSKMTNELYVTIAEAPAVLIRVVLEPYLTVLGGLVVFLGERPSLTALAVDATRELLVVGSLETAGDANDIARMGNRVYRFPLTDEDSAGSSSGGSDSSSGGGTSGGVSSFVPPPFRPGVRATDFPFVETPAWAGGALCAVFYPAAGALFLGTATGAMLRVRLSAFTSSAVDVFPGVGGSFPLVAVVFDAPGSSLVFATLSEPSLLPQVFLRDDEPAGFRNITIPAYEGSFSRVLALGIDETSRRVVVGTSANFASIAIASLETGTVVGPLRASGAGHALLSAILPQAYGGYLYIGTGTSLSRIRCADLFPEMEMSQSAALQPRAPVALAGVGDGSGRWLTMHKGTVVSTAQMVRYKRLSAGLSENGVNSVFVTGIVRAFTVAPKRDLAYVIITSQDSSSGPIIIFVAMRPSDMTLVGARALPLPDGVDLNGLVCERCAITTAGAGDLVIALALPNLDVVLVTFENNEFEIVAEMAPPARKFIGAATGLVEGPDGEVYVTSDAGSLCTLYLDEQVAGASVTANNGLLLPLVDPEFPWRIIAIGSEVLSSGEIGDQDIFSINGTLVPASAAFRTLPGVLGVVTGAVTFSNRIIIIGYSSAPFSGDPVIVLQVRTTPSSFIIEDAIPVPALLSPAALFAVQGPELLLISNGNPAVMAGVRLGKPGNVSLSLERRRYVPSAPEDDVLRPRALAYDKRSGWAFMGSSGGYIHVFRPDDGLSIAVLPPLATAPRDVLAAVMPVRPAPGSALAAMPQPIPGVRMAFMLSPQGAIQDTLLLLRMDIANMSNRVDVAHNDVVVGIADAAMLGTSLFACELGPPVRLHAFSADDLTRLQPPLILPASVGSAYRMAAIAAPPRPNAAASGLASGLAPGQLPHPSSVGALVVAGGDTYFTQSSGDSASPSGSGGAGHTAGSIAIVAVSPLRMLGQLPFAGTVGSAQLVLVHRPSDEPSDVDGTARYSVYGCWGDLGLATYLIKAEVSLRTDPAAATAAGAISLVSAVEVQRVSVAFIVPRHAVLSPSGRFIVIVGRTGALISGGEAAVCWHETATLAQVTCVRVLGGFGMLRGALALDEERLLIMTHTAPFRTAIISTSAALEAALQGRAINASLIEASNTVLRSYDFPSLKGGGRLNAGFFWVPTASNLENPVDLLRTQDEKCSGVPAYGTDVTTWRARPLMAVLVSRMSPGAMLIARMCDLSSVFYLPLDPGIASFRGATFDPVRQIAYLLVGDSASPALLSSRMTFNPAEAASLVEDLANPLSTPTGVFTSADGRYAYIVRSRLPPTVQRLLLGQPLPTLSTRGGEVVLPDSLPISVAVLAPARDPIAVNLPPATWLFIASASRTPTTILRAHSTLMYVVDRVSLPSRVAPAGIDALIVDAPRSTLIMSVGSVPARLLALRTWGGILPIGDGGRDAEDGLPLSLDPEVTAATLLLAMAILPDGMACVRSMVIHNATDSLYVGADHGLSARGAVLRYRLPDLAFMNAVPLPVFASSPALLLLDPPSRALLVSTDTLPAHISVLAAAPPTPLATSLRTAKPLPSAVDAVPTPPRAICAAVSAAFGLSAAAVSGGGSGSGAADGESASPAGDSTSSAAANSLLLACHFLTSANTLVVEALPLFGSFVNASSDVVASVTLLEPPVSVSYDRSRSVIRTDAVSRAASAWIDAPLRSALSCVSFSCDAVSQLDVVTAAYAAGNLSVEVNRIDTTGPMPPPSCFCVLPAPLQRDMARISSAVTDATSAWRLQLTVKLPGRPAASANATVLAGAPRLMHTSPPVLAAFVPAAAASVLLRAASSSGIATVSSSSDAAAVASSLGLIRADVFLTWAPGAALAPAVSMRMLSPPRAGTAEPLLVEACPLVFALNDTAATALGTVQLVCAPAPPQSRFFGRTFDMQLLVGDSVVSVIRSAVVYAWPVLSGVDPLLGLPADPAASAARLLTVTFPPLAALAEAASASQLAFRVWVESTPCDALMLLSTRRGVRCIAPRGAGAAAAIILEISGVDSSARPFAVNVTSWEAVAAAWRSSGAPALGGSDGSSAPPWAFAFYDGSPSSLSPDPPLRGLSSLVAFTSPASLSLAPDRLLLLPKESTLINAVSGGKGASDGVVTDGSSVALLISASEPLPLLDSVSVAVGAGRCDSFSRPSPRQLLCTMSAASIRLAAGATSSADAITAGTLPVNVSLILRVPAWPASTAVMLQAPPLRLYGRPCVAAISPDTAAPGATVLVAGSGFATSGPGSTLPALTPTVYFGTVPCTDLVVVSETQLLCTVPPRDPAAAAAAGGYTRVDVTVVTAVGASNGVSFAYPSALEIRWSTPESSSSSGSTAGAGVCGAAVSGASDGSDASSDGEGVLHLPGVSTLDPLPALEAVSGTVRTCQLSTSPQHADAAAGDSAFGVALRGAGPFDATDARVAFPAVSIASAAQLAPFRLALYGWCFGSSGSIARTSGPRIWRISAPQLSWAAAATATYASAPVLLPGSLVPAVAVLVSLDALPGEAPAAPWDANASVPAAGAAGSSGTSTSADAAGVRGITAISRRLSCSVAVQVASVSDGLATTQLAVFQAVAWTQYSFLNASSGGASSAVTERAGRHSAVALFPDVTLSGAPLGATLQLKASCIWLPTGASALVSQPLLLRTPAASLAWAVNLPAILEPQAVVRPAPTIQLLASVPASSGASASASASSGTLPLAVGGTLDCTLSAAAVHGTRSGSASSGANGTTASSSGSGSGELAEIVVAQRVSVDLLPGSPLAGGAASAPASASSSAPASAAAAAAVAFTSFSIAARRLSLFNASVRCSLGSASLPPLHALVRMAGCPPGREPAGNTGWLCTSCGAGEYSTGGASPCKRCPSRGASCAGGELRPLPGYWRPYQDAAKPLSATSEVHACANAEACALVALPQLTINTSVPASQHDALARAIIRDARSAAALAAALQQAAIAADAAIDGDGEAAAAAAAAAVPSYVYGCAVDLGYAAGSPLCGVCAAGFGMSGSVCRACWTAAAAGTVIALCILLALAAATWLALWHQPGDRSAAAIAFRQFFAFIQSLGVISAFRLQAMALLRAVLNWTEVASAALLSAGPLSCAAPLPLLARYVTSLCLPLALLAAVAAIATIARLCKARKAARAAAQTAAAKALVNSAASTATDAAAVVPGASAAPTTVALAPSEPPAAGAPIIVPLSGPPPLELAAGSIGMPGQLESESARSSTRHPRESSGTALRSLSSRIVASSSAAAAAAPEPGNSPLAGPADSPTNGEAGQSGSPNAAHASGSLTPSPLSSPVSSSMAAAAMSPLGALILGGSAASKAPLAASTSSAAGNLNAGRKVRAANAAAVEAASARARARASATLRFRLTSVGLLLLSLLYLPLLSASLRVLQCTAEPVAGAWYLLADLSVECYAGQHAVASAIAVAVLATLGVGFPALVLWKLSGKLPCVPQRCRDWSWSKVGSARRLRGRRGSMIAAEDTVWRPLKDGYRAQVQYFEAAVLARKGALAVAGGLLGDSVAGVAAVGVIAFAAAALQESLRPYEDRIFNDSERASLVAVLAAVLLSLLYTSDGAATPRNVAITIAIAAIAAGVTLLLAVRLARAGRTSARAALKRAKSLVSSRLLLPIRRTVSGNITTQLGATGSGSTGVGVGSGGSERNVHITAADARAPSVLAAGTSAPEVKSISAFYSGVCDRALVTANPLSSGCADAASADAVAAAGDVAPQAAARSQVSTHRPSRPRFSIGGITIGGAGASREADGAAAASLAAAGADAAAAAAYNRAARVSAVKRISLVAAHLLASQLGVSAAVDVDIAAAAALSDANDGRGSRSGSDEASADHTVDADHADHTDHTDHSSDDRGHDHDHEASDFGDTDSSTSRPDGASGPDRDGRIVF